MKCQVCSQENLMPFRCPYCGGQFCSAHRLPENHNCPRIDFARSEKQDRVITSKGHNSYNYSYVFGQQPLNRKYRIHFSPKELKHLSVAALLVIGIGFSIALYAFYWTWDIIAVFAGILTASFLLHEIGHKVMAQKSGMWAEFRLTMWGAILTFLSVFLPFKMIAPGAMMIGGTTPTSKQLVKISVVGPITNLILAFVLITLGFTVPLSAFQLMLFFSAYINAFMAVFNLIPFGVLDGYKIFRFNKTAWALVFVPSVAVTLFTYWVIFV